MGLTREDLENDLLRKSYEPFKSAVPLLSEDEFRASLERILESWDPQRDLWIFAYGSFIWNPLFHFVQSMLASIHGFHRCFCLLSRTRHSSLDKPRLVLGLGICRCCH